MPSDLRFGRSGAAIESVSGPGRAVAPGVRWLALLAAAGVVAGLGTVVPLQYLAAGLLLLLVAGFVLRIRLGSELLVIIFWAAFVLFSTVLVASSIAGMFIPLYLAMVLAIFGSSMRGGLKLDLPALWVYGLLLVVAFASLIGSAVSTSALMDRLILYPFGALALLQFNSATAYRWVVAAGAAVAVVVAIWVITSADEAGFAYRADLGVNQNLVSFYVGVGFVMVLAWLMGADNTRRPAVRWVMAAALPALAVMAYGLLLLSSRGASIALAASMLVLAARSAFRQPKRLLWLLIVALLVAGSSLLPGGAGLMQRFSSDTTASGGGRLDIWRVIGQEMASSSPQKLLLGHGFDSSSGLVSRNFGLLNSTHNAYLLVVYDMGLVGLALFVALLLIPLVRAVASHGPWSAVVAGLVTYLMITSLFVSTPNNFLFWTALSTAVAVSSRLPSAPGPARLERRPVAGDHGADVLS